MPVYTNELGGVGECTSFTLSPDLPPEIQFRIWRFAVFTPRDLFIFGQLSTFPTDAEEQIPDCYDLFSANPIPPVFHTCFDARQVAKKHYRKIHLYSHLWVPYSPRAYFQSDIDRLCIFPGPEEELDDSVAIELLTKLIRRYNIKRIALEHQEFDRATTWTDALGERNIKDWIVCNWLTPHRNVQEITLFVCDGDFEAKISNTAGAKLVDQEDIWIDSRKTRRLLSVKPGFMQARKKGMERYRLRHGNNEGDGNDVVAL